MKKFPVIAVIVLAITSFALSQTRLNGMSKQGSNVAKMAIELSDSLTPMKGSVPQSQCLTTFITESLSDFTVNEPVNFQIEVCCGTPPYRFELTGGTLPNGLHLNQNGKLTGKPTEIVDTTIFVRLTDSAGCSLTQAFALRVVPAA